MEFGKLPSLDGVDFSLPAEDPRTLTTLERGRGDFECFFGLPAVAVPQWIGSFYPPAARGDFLRFYARQLNGVEYNTTHYALPEPEAVAKWRDATPSGFRFCPKVSQAISHAEDLGAQGLALKTFCERMQGLGDRLGTCFMQLPTSATVQMLPKLARLLDALPDGFRLAVEFRHASWLQKSDTFELLASRQVRTVITDVAGRRDVLHALLPVPELFLRFVGNQGHDSDLPRLRTWCERIAQWKKRGLERAYVFLHQPDNIGAPPLVNHFVRELNSAAGTKLEPWRPTQGDLFG